MSQTFMHGSTWRANGILIVWLLLWATCGILTDLFRILDGATRDAVGPPSIWPAIGLLLGIGVYYFQHHPRRVLGLLPIGAFGLTLVLGMLYLGVAPSPFMELLTGFMLGMMMPPVLVGYRIVAPANSFFIVLFFVVWFVLTPVAAWALSVAIWASEPAWVQSTFLLILLAVSGAGCAFGTWLLFRELLELFIEVFMWPLYRVRAQGVGLQMMPRRGPCLVIANHSAWFDPMWLAKALPRKMLPMMTSVFYDLPVIRWLMVHAAQAIRVQASNYKRETPELREAIAVLDRGEAVVVFPEGSMRRKEEIPLKQFGQGVWHILKERPETPVIACWIDGGWGCYFSYWNGLPTKNKKVDFWRKIEIGVAAPEVIDPSLLVEHRALRTHLMKAVLEARRQLGKEPYQLEERGALAEEENNHG